MKTIYAYLGKEITSNPNFKTGEYCDGMGGYHPYQTIYDVPISRDGDVFYLCLDAFTSRLPEELVGLISSISVGERFDGPLKNGLVSISVSEVLEAARVSLNDARVRNESMYYSLKRIGKKTIHWFFSRKKTSTELEQSLKLVEDCQ